jgi:hypothetical protein
LPAPVWRSASSADDRSDRPRCSDRIFQADCRGGKTGYLINTRSLCAKKAAVDVAYTAQNAKTRSESVKIKTACGKKEARAKRHGFQEH